MGIRPAILLLFAVIATPLDARAEGPIARLRARWAARRLEKSGVIVVGGGTPARGLTTMINSMMAESRLMNDAGERVAAGKRPTWRQRRLLRARARSLQLEVDVAAKGFEQPRLHGVPVWTFQTGADWLNALTGLEATRQAMGELTAERKTDHAERRRAATMAIFERMTGEIHELADAGMHLSLGRGAEDYKQLMQRMHGRGDGDDGRGVLALVHDRWAAAEAAPGQSRALLSRWARADVALARMAETRRAFAERQAGVGRELDWRALRGRSLRDVSRMTEKRQMEMYLRGELDHLREPAQLLANVPPDRLLGQIERGDFAGWGEKLGMSDAAFAEQLAKGLQLSFGRAYRRSLGRVRATIAHKNPLLAAEGQEELATLRGTIALAARHGVAIDPGGPEPLAGRTREDFESTLERARPQGSEPLAGDRARRARVTADKLLGEEQLSELEARKSEVE